MKFLLNLLPALLLLTGLALGQKQDSAFVRANYIKVERMIPMRDGVKLFTAIYMPRDQSLPYPILMERTPYSSEPFGESSYPEHLSSNRELEQGKYIFVFQDVRGRYMSEGKFEEMTPHKALKKSKNDTDESSDTFDTIDWLLKNVRNNNGKVGIYGISYPGFYASASLPDAHPALKAVSPQAPVTDEFAGDDVYHNGAFFLMDNFSFYGFFDAPRPAPWKEYPALFSLLPVTSPDFYHQIEPISVAEDKYFKGQSKIWKEVTSHNTYDDYWKARNIRPHLKGVKPAVLVVGGWFDPEDLFGPLHTYQAIEQQTQGNDCRLVMGPWTHGAWVRKDWSTYADYDFGSNTADAFKKIESAFFEYYLKGTGSFGASEATVFITGSNEWRSFATWPPKETETLTLYLEKGSGLSFTKPTYDSSFAGFVSDPDKPVPYVNSFRGNRNNEYMGADQRFAATRPDVLVYQTNTLEADMTLTGPLEADLFFSTTGTDADIIVKIIDVQPDHAENPNPNPRNMYMPGMQQLVRAEVMRGKFRNSLERPEPFVPNRPTEVRFSLNDLGHTFRKGHRLMVQIQSTWFPLVDLNPQRFLDISKARIEDFQTSTHRIYTGKEFPSSIRGLKLK